MLTYKLGLDVINLEGNPCHNDEASGRSVEVQKRLHNQLQRKLRAEGKRGEGEKEEGVKGEGSGVNFISRKASYGKIRRTSYDQRALFFGFRN